jgi:hypothetical protein
MRASIGNLRLTGMMHSRALQKRQIARARPKIPRYGSDKSAPSKQNTLLRFCRWVATWAFKVVVFKKLKIHSS